MKVWACCAVNSRTGTMTTRVTLTHSLFRGKKTPFHELRRVDQIRSDVAGATPDTYCGLAWSQETPTNILGSGQACGGQR